MEDVFSELQYRSCNPLCSIVPSQNVVQIMRYSKKGFFGVKFGGGFHLLNKVFKNAGHVFFNPLRHIKKEKCNTTTTTTTKKINNKM